MGLLFYAQPRAFNRRSISEGWFEASHRGYTQAVNFREGWRGHLWQGRFSSHAMEERYLLTAVRYIELNPVRAALVQKPEEYRWSSAAAHLAGRDDFFMRVASLHRLVANWESFLSEAPDEEEVRLLKKHERTGRPLGNPSFVGRLEESLGRTLRPQPPGPKKKK